MIMGMQIFKVDLLILNICSQLIIYLVFSNADMYLSPPIW